MNNDIFSIKIPLLRQLKPSSRYAKLIKVEPVIFNPKSIYWGHKKEEVQSDFDKFYDIEYNERNR